ncbi:MAG: hypothetical protein ACOC1E_01380 [Marinilabiliaceae bacterium]
MKQTPKTFLIFINVVMVWLLANFSGCESRKEASEDTASEEEIADTVLYAVDVVNLDSADQWADKRLQRLDHPKMADMLFDALYNGDARAVDYFSGEKIPAEDVREMEESGEFDREELAQIQFEESWYFDPEKARMTKEVHSVLLAWPVFNKEGEVQAYEAGFVLELNP